jgi:hypothetical protein
VCTSALLRLPTTSKHFDNNSTNISSYNYGHQTGRCVAGINEYQREHNRIERKARTASKQGVYPIQAKPAGFRIDRLSAREETKSGWMSAPG